jgi:hypothetical protein
MNRRRKGLVVLFFIAICAAVPATNYFLNLRAGEVMPSDLYKVVYNQVNAFRADNFSLAYSHASNSMQQKFSLPQFEAMIRTDYTDITQAERIEFGIVKSREHHALIQVFFIGHDGSILPCIYSLIYEGDDWKIDGARMLPRWPADSQGDGITI